MTIYSRIVISGNEVTDTPSFQVIKTISDMSASSNFTGYFNNYAGYNANKYEVGNSVDIYAQQGGSEFLMISGAGSIYNSDYKIFTGLVEDIKYYGEGIKQKMELRGRDYSARLMDRTVEPEVYTNLQAGSIVKDIIAKYTDDLTTSNVQINGSVVSRIAFNQTPVYDAIKQLADFQGYMVYVDDDRDLHFEPKGGSSTGYTFDNTNVLKGNFIEKRDTCYNQVWVYGDRYLDGFKETLTFGSPIGSVLHLLYKPSNTQVTVSGALIQPGGILSMAVGSDVKYLVDYDNQNIVFTSGTSQGANIPQSGNAVIVDYKRLLPIVKVGDDNSSQAVYGKRVKIIQDKTIKDPQTAEDLMLSELAKAPIPQKEGNLLIDGIAKIQPGYTCIINLPDNEIVNQTYDIIESRYELNTEDLLHEHPLTIKLNKKLPDLTDRIKQIMLDLKKLQAGDMGTADLITRYQSSTGSFGIRTSGCLVYTNSLTFSGLSCYWNGGNINFCGTLASGTLQKGLYGSGTNIGSPTTPFSLVYSGGYF